MASSKTSVSFSAVSKSIGGLAMAVGSFAKCSTHGTKRIAMIEYQRARYAQWLGRWTNADTNLQRYVRNNPVPKRSALDRVHGGAD